MVFTFAFDAFALLALPFFQPLPLSAVPLPAESAPTSIGTALLLMFVEVAPDMMPGELYSSTLVEKSLTKVRNRW